MVFMLYGGDELSCFAGIIPGMQLPQYHRISSEVDR